MCNLNFNQCNGGSYYPPLLDTCRSQLRSLLNANTTTIINPITEASFAYANLSQPQTVGSGDKIGVRRQVGAGMAIGDNGDGSFNLGQGTYDVEFGAAGVVPPGGMSLGLVLDGQIVESSVVTTDSVGSLANLYGRAVFTIGATGALLSVNNVLNNNLTINRAFLIINRINLA